MGNTFSRNDSDNNATSLIHKSQEATTASHQPNRSDLQNCQPTSHTEYSPNPKSTTPADIRSFSESQRNPQSSAGLTSPSRFLPSGPRPSPNKSDNIQNRKLKGQLPHKCIECGEGFRHEKALLRHRVLHPPSVTTQPAPPDMDDPRGESSALTEMNPKSQRVPRGILARLRPSRGRMESLPPADGHQPAHTVQDHTSLPNLQNHLPGIQPVDLTGRVTISSENYKNPISGGLSLVYRGELDGRPVAVKIPQIRAMQKLHHGWYSDTHRRFNREVDAGYILDHENINEVLGFATNFHAERLPAIISPWCEQGTVQEYLNRVKPPINERIRLARDITAGVQYLHQRKLVHGDIKPPNALVDDKLVARLCDLGCLQPFPGYGPLWMVTEAPFTGTKRYKAPELFVLPDRPRPKPTAEGDIYALGCLLMEVVEEIWTFEGVEDKDLKGRISNGEFPGSRPETSKLPEDLADRFWGLLNDCWGEAASRPTIERVAEVLSSLNPCV